MKVLELLDYLQQTIEMSPKNLMGKVSLNKKEIVKTISEIRKILPDEFEESSNLLKRRDAILGDAHRESERIIEESKKQAQEEYESCDILVSAKMEAEQILNEANAEAKKIRAKAEKDAKEMKFGVMHYADSTLSELQKNMDIIGEESLKEVQKEMEEMLVKLYKQISTTSSRMREDIKELSQD